MSRSKHSLTHYKEVTCDMGQIVPIGLIPVLPGDSISMQTNLLARVSPLAAPVMHQVDARIHHFYCANRVLWPETDAAPGWESFITGGEDGMNADTIPQLTTTGTPKDLWDLYGVPPNPGVSLNALPIYAYNDIINEFYRDQDLQSKRDPDDVTIARCCWEKDYASTARPWAQKGPQVSIPVAGEADVTVDSASADDIGIYNKQASAWRKVGTPDTFADVSATAANATGAYLKADLSTAAGADPIDVRFAWGMQRFMEDAAKYGSRYPEKMRRLGSLYSGLLERPEFLAGGRQAINFSEVLQTANDVGDREFGVADMYGHGIAAMKSNKFQRRIDEHGYIVSLLSVRPKTLYQDGVHREWLKLDREDFHDPFLEHVGMQEVWNGELDLDHAAGERGAFGFSDRYDEYRSHPSCVAGEFRDILNYWHLARNLTDPVLNDTFVTCNPSKRIFNEQTQDSLWCMAHNKVMVHRNISSRARNELI